MTASSLKPVEIIGGGIAGLSLGLALRRAGVPVTLVEAGDYPRHRVCGEFITGLDTVTIDRLGLAPILVDARPHREVSWFLRDRLICRQTLPGPALALSRHVLDQRLANAFVSAGGELRPHTRADLSQTPDGRIFATSRKPVRSDWIGLKCHAHGLVLKSELELHLGDNAYVGLCAVEAVLVAHPNAVVACVAVEICSAAFYLDDDPGVLISACLFSDGAAASIWRNTPGPDGLRIHGFNTLHLPAERDKLRFEMRDGKLCNRLHSTVPTLAADAATRLLADEPTTLPPVHRIIAHHSGRDVLDALEAALPGYTLDASRRVLRDHSNMSSPSVLFALEDALRDTRPATGEDWWLVSFGAGFSVHSCRLSAG